MIQSRQRTIVHLMDIDQHKTNSRFLKEAHSVLKAGLADRVVICSVSERIWPEYERIGEAIEAYRFHLLPGSRFRWAQRLRYELASRRLLAFVAALQPSLIVSRMVSTLPNAVRLKRRLGVPLVYAPHELETRRMGVDAAVLELDAAIERRAMDCVDAVVTVSPSIADWYQREYGVDSPLVVRNVPDAAAEASSARPPDLRRAAGVDDDAILFLYLGVLGRGRRIDQLLELFGLLAKRGQKNKHLAFVGYGPMERDIRSAALASPNIHLLDAVPSNIVVDLAAQADVGIVGVENRCLSYYFSLPNKLFEYTAAGLPVLAPDFPDIAKVVRQLGVGWLVADDPTAWLEQVSALAVEDVRAAKQQAHSLRDRFAWQQEVQPLLERYRGLIPGQQPTGSGLAASN
jgi:glycosyltransferase involved in cell wall biosynthesis